VDQLTNTSNEPLHVPNRPITWSKTKPLKEVLNVSTKSDLKGPLEHQENALVHLIHMQEVSNPTLFGPWGFDNKADNFLNFQQPCVYDVLMCFVDS
jgi:hypothetical protein